jgi:hypothetical protein
MPKPADVSPKKIVNIDPVILQQIKKANDIDWDNLLPLTIKYGRNPVITATGLVVGEFAEELIKADLLRRNSVGDLVLNCAKRALSKDDVEAHMRLLESYCVQQGHIPGLRGERLYLGDELNTELTQRYASYDRNLDVMGFVIHSVSVVPYQCTGNRKGDLVLAKRHPGIVALNDDSKWNLLSGAIEYGTTAFATIVSEGYDEYGLSVEQMRRARAIETICGHRSRDNPYSVVREKMEVYTLGLTKREIKRLECHDIKQVTIGDTKGISSTMRVHVNVGFVRISPKKIINRLYHRRHLKNGKALSVMSYLLHAGHIAPSAPLAGEVRAGLARKPKVYCRSRHAWFDTPRRPVRGSTHACNAGHSKIAVHEQRL